MGFNSAGSRHDIAAVGRVHGGSDPRATSRLDQSHAGPANRLDVNRSHRPLPGPEQSVPTTSDRRQLASRPSRALDQALRSQEVVVASRIEGPLAATGHGQRTQIVQ